MQTFVFTCTIADLTDFDREADTLDQAVRTAIDDLEKAGLQVSDVRLDVQSLKAIDVA